MKPSTTLTILSSFIAVLAFIAAATGIFYQNGGTPFDVTSVRGERVEIYGQGLYQYESTLLAVQVIPQDVVTLVVGIPLLLVALRLYRQRQVRGQLLLAGTLGYFLYTYTSMAFGATFNALFLVYVALFALSVFAFTLAMLSVDVASLPTHFTAKLPRRGIATFMFISSAFLLFAWLGRIIPALQTGAAPVGLGSNTTLFIQVLDLGLVVPVMILAGVLLLRRHPLGYLLASVGQIKFAMFGVALIAMIIGQWRGGVPMAIAEVVIFPVIALFAIVMAVLLLRDLKETVGVEPETPPGIPPLGKWTAEHR